MWYREWRNEDFCAVHNNWWWWSFFMVSLCREIIRCSHLKSRFWSIWSWRGIFKTYFHSLAICKRSISTYLLTILTLAGLTDLFEEKHEIVTHCYWTLLSMVEVAWCVNRLNNNICFPFHRLMVTKVNTIIKLMKDFICDEYKVFRMFVEVTTLLLSTLEWKKKRIS